jgi:hypothetical protein
LHSLHNVRRCLITIAWLPAANQLLSLSAVLFRSWGCCTLQCQGTGVKRKRVGWLTWATHPSCSCGDRDPTQRESCSFPGSKSRGWDRLSFLTFSLLPYSEVIHLHSGYRLNKLYSSVTDCSLKIKCIVMYWFIYAVIDQIRERSAVAHLTLHLSWRGGVWSKQHSSMVDGPISSPPRNGSTRTWPTLVLSPILHHPVHSTSIFSLLPAVCCTY